MGNFYDIFYDPDSGSDAIATALGLPLEALMGGGRSREEIISGLILLITALGAEACEAEIQRIDQMLFVSFGSLFMGGQPGGEGTQ
jgi:hypothetical protein